MCMSNFLVRTFPVRKLAMQLFQLLFFSRCAQQFFCIHTELVTRTSLYKTSTFYPIIAGEEEFSKENIKRGFKNVFLNSNNSTLRTIQTYA